ncbi:MAG: hypothetical protein J6M31_02965 [Bacteroidales bacterium]|nr:hypothetical protein [Bacteroidales bacterium]
MEIKLKKVHTAKDLIISAIVLAAGIGLYFVNTGLGAVIGVCGLLMLLFYKAGYKREGEGIVLKKKALDVAHTCRDSLKGFLDGKDVEPEVKTNISGGVIRLEAYYNADAAIAYVQLFDFSNYTYEPATGIVELRGPKAEKLISKL